MPIKICPMCDEEFEARSIFTDYCEACEEEEEDDDEEDTDDED